MPSRQPAPAVPRDRLLKLDHQLCFALYSATRAMTRAYTPLLAGLGLTYPQYLALLVLWERDALTLGELGQRLHLDSGTLTPLMKRLEAQGLVERRRGTDDERTLLLHLTPEGRALKRRAAAIPEAMRCTLGCDLDELSDLMAQLNRLRDTLSPTPENPR